MTYLITPYHEAISINDRQHYIINDGPTYAVVQTSFYHGASCDCNISPKYMYDDYKYDDDITDEDAKGEAMYEAIKWLEDLLIRLSKNPILIHCTSDGEMFIR